MTDRYEGVTHLVHISTGIGESCEHCSESIGLEKFASSVNHYIEQHGYRVLHVGSEWSEDSEYKTIHHTVAVLGK